MTESFSIYSESFGFNPQIWGTFKFRNLVNPQIWGLTFKFWGFFRNRIPFFQKFFIFYFIF